MSLAYDKHHVSHTPSITQIISHRRHQEIHNNIPIDTPLSRKMRQYDKIVQLSTMIKNWRTSYQREFDRAPLLLAVAQLTKRKKEILTEVNSLIADELKKVEHIKGLGIRYLAGLLAYAHPMRFRTLHRFLLYCGYKGGFSKFNRKIKGIMHQVAIQLLIHKDPHYYPLYIKIKAELRKRFPDYRKAKIDGMARNRMATFLLKEVYALFRNG